VRTVATGADEVSAVCLDRRNGGGKWRSIPRKRGCGIRALSPGRAGALYRAPATRAGLGRTPAGVSRCTGSIRPTIFSSADDSAARRRRSATASRRARGYDAFVIGHFQERACGNRGSLDIRHRARRGEFARRLQHGSRLGLVTIDRSISSGTSGRSAPTHCRGGSPGASDPHRSPGFMEAFTDERPTSGCGRFSSAQSARWSRGGEVIIQPAGCR